MAYVDTDLDVWRSWNSTDRLLDVAPCPPPWKPGLLYKHERTDELTETEISVIARRCNVKKHEPFVLGAGVVALIASGAFLFVLILTIVYCRCRYDRIKKLTNSSNSFTSETELTPGGKETDSIEGDNPTFSGNEESCSMKNYETTISSKNKESCSVNSYETILSSTNKELCLMKNYETIKPSKKNRLVPDGEMLDTIGIIKTKHIVK